eukprot:gene11045-12301_t
MNVNIEGADRIVGEYLIYRGFTQTLQSLESESHRDRTKKFEVIRIVEAIFTNLMSFEMESFLFLWDFLNKRFFFHLDVEHFHLAVTLKTDLLKFYLIHAIKSKNRDRVTEFFTSYSHEILADQTTSNGAANSAGGGGGSSLRNWFVLPYLEEPEKDPEFSIYFSSRWAELLRITLQNFLSIVLASAPPPRLLMLEKWYRSEGQQEIRSRCLSMSKEIDLLRKQCEKYEERLERYQEIIKQMATFCYKSSYLSPAPSSSTALAGGSAAGSNNASTSTTGSIPSSGGGKALFMEDGEEGRVQALGSAVVKLANDCLSRSRHRRQSHLATSSSLSTTTPSSSAYRNGLSSVAADDRGSMGYMSGSMAGGSEEQDVAEQAEVDLLNKLQDWLQLLTLQGSK